MLKICLERIVEVLSPGDELVVVDSASTTDQVRVVAMQHDLIYVRSEKPGSSLARNIGWKTARHPIVAFVDDDVRVYEGWADSIARAFEDPNVSLLTARVSIPPGQNPERPVAVTYDTDPHVIDAGSETAFESSACCAFRREVLEAVGGFDERLGIATWFGAAEDSDLFDRVRRAGFRGRYEPSVQAEHDQWRGRRQLLALEWRYGKGMGAHLWLVSNRAAENARRQAHSALWKDGLRKLGPAIRTHHEFLIACELLRFTGTVFGFLTAVVRLRRTTWPIA